MRERERQWLYVSEIALGAAGLVLSKWRPRLGAFVYSVALSRAHGISRDRLQARVKGTIEDLFAQKTSVGNRLGELEHEKRVAALERGEESTA
jgi:hypothetical protein